MAGELFEAAGNPDRALAGDTHHWGLDIFLNLVGDAPPYMCCETVVVVGNTRAIPTLRGMNW